MCIRTINLYRVNNISIVQLYRAGRARNPLAIIRYRAFPLSSFRLRRRVAVTIGWISPRCD